MSARVGVVGGGILGTVLALRLAQAGAEVTVLERAPSPGGLAGSMDFGGHRIDRFYHAITPADRHLIGLAAELLGFEARTGLDDGLERTLAWHRVRRATRAAAAAVS